MGYTIGEVADQLGLAPSTLRYYEAEGLLPSVARTAGGRRVYTGRDLEACRVVECLKSSGLSIRQIKDFMDMAVAGDGTLADRLALFRQRRAAVERQVRELEEVLAVLDFKTWYYEQALAAGTEEAVRALPDARVPERHHAARQHLSAVPA